MQADYADFLWLTTAEGLAWIRKVEEDDRPLPQLLRSLRRDLPAARAGLVVEQTLLRRRAAEKFPWAGTMLFTRKGLEQATDAWVGCYKATYFPAEEAVADLCCGIGGDLISLAFHREVAGVDQDRLAALFARFNAENVLSACGIMRRVEVFVDDVTRWGQRLSQFSAWHLDPDRRPEGVRTAQPAWSSPAPEVVAELYRSHAGAAIKLAPAASVAYSWAKEGQREWIAFRGRCRQQVLWLGKLATAPGLCAATVVESSNDPRHVVAERVVGQPNLPLPVARKIGSFVFDPSPAVLAAHLEGATCQKFGLEALSTQGGYLTGESVPQTRLLSPYRVEEILPFDQAKLRHWVKSHSVGEVVIKKRSPVVDEEKLRQLLRGKGTKRVVFIITEHAGRFWAIVVDAVQPTSL